MNNVNWSDVESAMQVLNEPHYYANSCLPAEWHEARQTIKDWAFNGTEPQTNDQNYFASILRQSAAPKL